MPVDPVHRFPPAEAPSDEELVRRVRAGAFGAFEVLVRRHGRRVERAVRSVLRDPADVEDAVQQALLQAFVGLRGFAGASTFATWVTRIGLNEALMRVRRSVREGLRVVDADEVATEPARAPDEEAASREAVRLVARAVGRLPRRHREVFRLRHVEGLTVLQTAARLGVTEAAVKLRLHRARIVLRGALADAPVGGRWHGRVAVHRPGSTGEP